MNSNIKIGNNYPQIRNGVVGTGWYNNGYGGNNTNFYKSNEGGYEINEK